MWFFETGVTYSLGRKYQNRYWVGITETYYTFSWDRDTCNYCMHPSIVGSNFYNILVANPCNARENYWKWNLMNAKKLCKISFKLKDKY